MIVRTLEDIIGTDRDVSGPGWLSRRLILRRDGMGASVHDTTVTEGAELHIHFKHHFETNYCVGGEGEVVDVATGRTYPIRPGTVYALDKNDEHILAGDARRPEARLRLHPAADRHRDASARRQLRAGRGLGAVIVIGSAHLFGRNS